MSAAMNIVSLHRKVALSLIKYLSMPIGGIAELSKTVALRLVSSAPRRFLEEHEEQSRFWYTEVFQKE
jgi:hypothetical protein